MLSCSYRNRRNTVILFLVVVGIYIPLSVIRTVVMTSYPANTDNKLAEIHKLPSYDDVIKDKLNDLAINASKQLLSDDLKVHVKRVYPALGEEGTINLLLSVNVNDLLKHVEDLSDITEATTNPVPNPPDWIVPNVDFCKTSKGLKYLIYVHSLPSNSEQRIQIRNTWGNRYLFADGQTNLVFFIGKSINDIENTAILKESKLYGDIVILDLEDSSQNATLKGVAALKWVSMYCKAIEYAIKADDEAFVNIFELIKVLQKENSEGKRVTCLLWGDKAMPILRDPETCRKWCVKPDEFPGQTHFPQYCAGLTFAMKRNVISEMYKKSKSTPFFWLEDVYVTGLLLGKMKNVKYTSLARYFTQKEDLAVIQYKNTAQTLTYFIVRIADTNNVPILWKYALKRLSDSELNNVNKTALSTYLKDI